MTIQLSPNLSLPLPNGTSEDLRFQDIVAIKDALVILDQKINRQFVDNPTKLPSYTFTVNDTVPNENGLLDYTVTITTFGVAGGTILDLTGTGTGALGTDYTIVPSSVTLVGDKRIGATATVIIKTNLNSARKTVALSPTTPEIIWGSVQSDDIFISKYYDQPTLNLTNSTYGNGIYIALAPNSEVASVSYDGINWRNQLTFYNNNSTDIVFGNNLFVVYTKNTNQLLISSNTLTWSRTGSGLDSGDGSIIDWKISFINNTFVAIAVTGNGTDIIKTSIDGDAWFEHILPNVGDWVIYPLANGEFAGFARASVYAFTTADFDTYVTQPIMPINQGNYFVSTGNIDGSVKYVAINNSLDFYTSTNGVTWILNTLTKTAGWTDICYGGGKFVAISGTPNAQNTGSEAMYSIDGINWIHFSIEPNDTWTTVLYDGVKFIAHGYNQNRGSSVETLNI